MTNASLSKAKQRFRSRWALMPIALLTSSVLGVSFMATVAVRDPNFALEADYYQKAVHWEDSQAQAAINQRLAYHVELPRTVRLDRQGRAALELTISDRNGLPLAGARVAADAFANAYSGQIQQLGFTERAPGIYVAPIRAVHPGLWELRVKMTEGADLATVSLRCDLMPGGAA